MRVFLCDAGNIPQDVLKKAAQTLPEDRVPRDSWHKDAYAARVVSTLLVHYAIWQLCPVAVCEKWLIAKGGKPFIEDCPVHFSISHADGVIAVAVSNDHPVGVDTQEVRALREGFMTRYFSEGEQAQIRTATDRDEALIRLWTAKEAVGKYQGTGLNGDPHAIDTQNATSVFYEKNGARFALSVSPKCDIPTLEWVDFEDLVP